MRKDPHKHALSFQDSLHNDTGRPLTCGTHGAKTSHFLHKAQHNLVRMTRRHVPHIRGNPSKPCVGGEWTFVILRIGWLLPKAAPVPLQPHHAGPHCCIAAEVHCGRGQIHERTMSVLRGQCCIKCNLVTAICVKIYIMWGTVLRSSVCSTPVLAMSAPDLRRIIHTPCTIGCRELFRCRELVATQTTQR